MKHEDGCGQGRQPELDGQDGIHLADELQTDIGNELRGLGVELVERDQAVVLLCWLAVPHDRSNILNTRLGYRL